MPGPVGDTGATGATGAAGGTPYTAVANLAGLPAAAANVAKSYYVTDTATIVVSDGIRWRTVYGDTGWRVLTSWDAAGVVTGISLQASFVPRPTSVGSIRIRRTGSTVMLDVAQMSTAAAMTAGVSYPIIAFNPVPGWNPTNADGYHVFMAGVGAAIHAIRLYGGFIQFAAGGALTSGAVAVASNRTAATWMTIEPWPTTLPGTAGGGIP